MVKLQNRPECNGFLVISQEKPYIIMKIVLYLYKIAIIKYIFKAQNCNNNK